jgi:predicted GIY-YIG superfamily endonuclease
MIIRTENISDIKKDIWKFQNIYDKGYLYVLEIDDKNIYIGATIDLSRRLKEHRDRRGCFTTRNYKELKLIDSYILHEITFNELETYETYLTIKYAKENKWNSVTGGIFCGLKHRRKKTDISIVEFFRVNKVLHNYNDHSYFNKLKKFQFNDNYDFIKNNKSPQTKLL